ncbi:Alanine dehydrogenase [Candidatus Promineifilum breve]|uniref:Alanine dehydrogenase n=1 Tax=Candidatus Promineifilum breve TaxID=1806508 RepID=A0A160T776_9CHLR|nr:alanine dehydrogenase [Candidatus Promineifilum breve]CUS05469.2 Alanine dehydrogenase [Candidatus Promineifilum breve]
MLVGVPKEIKDNEYRVAMTPAGVQQLVEQGHTVLVETTAGDGSRFTDDQYTRVGAKIVPTAADAWGAEMVIKVKEPIAVEYPLLRSDLVLFTYLHLAAEEKLTKAMVDSGVTGIAYETVEARDGSLPLLTPMSEVAGRMAVQVGAHFLERSHLGRGMLLGGVAGVPGANVVVIGGGVVGTNSAHIALGMGANVTILDTNLDRLRFLDHVLHGRLTTVASNSYNIAEAVRTADLVIGGVLIKGARAPRLVTREMISTMNPGSVIADVAVDQGGCVETIHATTHSDPVYIVDGVVHYGVANMPGAVPRTSTFALSNATLPYVLRLARLGAEEAMAEDDGLMKGLNTYRGQVTYQAVADYFGLAYTPYEA